MNLKFYLEYVVFKLAYFFINSLPEPVAYRFGLGIGNIAYIIDRKHRAIARRNIALSLPEKTGGEIERIVKNNYRNLSLNLIEFFRMPALDKSWYKRNVAIKGQSIVEAALEKGSGVVFLVSHFGNWELMGGCGSICLLENVPQSSLYAVGRPMKNPLTDSFIYRLRIATGMRIVPKKNVLRELIRKLNENQTIGILADQNAGHEGVFVQFLGREASTVTSPVVLALKTNAAVIPVFMIREGIKKHTMIVEQPLTITRSGDFYRDIYENTQSFTHKIEEYVRKYPEQWFWLHQRWKTRRQEVKRLRFQSVYQNTEVK